MKFAHCIAVLSVAATAWGQQPDFSKVQIKTTKVTPGVYMLEGQGGNMGVSVGDDGVILIDTEFAPLTPKIQAAISALSTKPIRFVINTHWHADHTGGNENFAAAGAVILAHDNVRKRLSVDQFIELMHRTVPASPPKALPIVTFSEDVTLHLNGDTIHVFHVPPAHTDGDVIVHFQKANAIHTGDTFVSGYPLVDWSSGGSFEGFIGAADRILAIADDHTQVIPGHGPLSDRKAIEAWKAMLVGIRDRVKADLAAGKSLDQIKAAKPTTSWDARYGNGFIKGDMVLDMAYRTMSKPPPGVPQGNRP
jgi:cyclase